MDPYMDPYRSMFCDTPTVSARPINSIGLQIAGRRFGFSRNRLLLCLPLGVTLPLALCVMLSSFEAERASAH